MIVLIPAYGRRYDSEDAALVDWENGRDFKIAQGPYTSIRDLHLLERDFGSIHVWYNFPCHDPAGIVSL